MRFSAFYVLSGVCLGVAVTKTTVAEPWWGWFVFVAVVMMVVGALFEANV